MFLVYLISKFEQCITAWFITGWRKEGGVTWWWTLCYFKLRRLDQAEFKFKMSKVYTPLGCKDIKRNHFPNFLWSSLIISMSESQRYPIKGSSRTEIFFFMAKKFKVNNISAYTSLWFTWILNAIKLIGHDTL